MAGELILLTGVTGHLGYPTLIEALSAGYKVRAAVRREASIAEVKATKSIQPYLSDVSFVVVDDITKEGAFDEALKGVDYVVHIASPLPKPSNDPEAEIIQPAINGTLSILNSALKEPSIKRVVITSSQAAVTPMEAYASGYDKVITPETRVPNPKGPYPNHFAAYASSKIQALNHTLDFIDREKPRFSVINIMPSFIVGKSELHTLKEAVRSGSNAIAFNPIMGVKNPAGAAGVTVHVDDVAYVHIAALDPKIEGHQNFGCNSNGLDGTQWDDALDIVRKNFPEAVEKGIFPLTGSQKSNPLKFDALRTEEVFNFKFKNFEEQIKSMAGWYAEVVAS